MGAHVDVDVRCGPGGDERLVDETDNVIAAVTECHGESPFVIPAIGSPVRTLKD